MFKLIVILCFITIARCSPCGPYPCIPGADYVGIGYDAVQGQSTGVQVLQFTFDQKNFWVNPFQTSNDTTYSVADQILAVESSGMKTYSWSFEEAYSYSNFLANQYGIDVSSILDSSGWFLTQVAEMQKKVESEDQTFSLTEQSISLYELTYAPSATLLSKAFQQDAMTLPTTYDFATYLSFIQAYGTHVVVSATLGGKSSYKSFTDSVYTTSNSNFVVGGNAKSDFYNVKGSVGGDYSHSHATTDFKEHGVSNYERAGGDPTIDKSQWRDWVNTIGNSPVVIKSQLRPLSDFVNDITRSTFLKQTIEKYASNNSFSQQTKSKTYQLSRCGCYTATVPYGCSDGDLMTGTAMDGDSPYQATFCCHPCFSWSSSSFSDTLASERKTSGHKKDPIDAFVKQAERKNKSSPSKCGTYECIPGLDSFGVTFDAVKGQSKHIPAVSFTYSQGKIWQNPWNPNLVYAVPDQINLINNPEELQFYELINSTDSYRSYLSTQAGLDLSFFGFGLSDEVSSSTETFFMNQNVLTILSTEFSFYKFALSFHWNTSSEIMKALRSLNADTSKEKYTRFIQTYGTHFIGSATYGGKSKMLTSVNQNYFMDRTEDEIEAMVGLMYNGFALGFNENVTMDDGFEDFYSSSFSEFYLEGGNYLQYSADQLEEWKKSILYAPAQLQYSLRPISDLITNSSLRQEFAFAVDQYSKISLSTSIGDPLVSNPYNGNSDGQCQNGWAQYYTTYQQNTNHYELPLACNSYASSSGSFSNPVNCNCQSEDAPLCPEDTFVTAATLYAGWSGNFPKLPLTCCGLCLSTM